MKTIDVLTQILKTPDIDLTMSILSDFAKQFSLAHAPSLFLLSTQRAVFVGVFGIGKYTVRPINQEVPEDRYIVGKRNNCIIGFLEWEAPISQVDYCTREVIGAVIEEVYRRTYVKNFFKSISRPVDFTNQDEHIREIAKLLSDSLSMEMVAIRQINSADSLDCQVFFHYPNKFIDGIDFEGGSNMPPPFRELILETKLALLEHKVDKLGVKFEIVDHSDTQRYKYLLSDDQLKEVKAFAIFPIVMGDEFFGVISCSTTAAIGFTLLEKTATQTAMQLVSVAISNCLRFHEVRRMTDVIHDQLFSATELEIAQSARHELQNIEAEQVLHIDEFDAYLRDSKDKVLIEIASKLKNTVSKLGTTISKFRYSGVHAAPKLEETSVAKIWNEATNLMEERLGKMRIKTKYVGQNLEDDFYADWLREAFLNLLFNSMDAFRDRPRQNRSITVVAQKDSELSNDYILDYSDNAGGIIYSKLSVPKPISDSNPGMRPEQLIFQPKVTSKKAKKGAGWGLYLVRQALRIHNGSISLRSNTKEGCTFRIKLPKNLKNKE